MRLRSARMFATLTLTFAALGPATALAAAVHQPATYTIRQGDTLYRIAEARHLPLTALELANPQLSNPNQIAAGQTVTLPTTYTVQPGDTIYLIAQAHNLTVSAILQANPGINPLDLMVGQTLFLPIPAANTAAVPPTSTGTASSSGTSASSDPSTSSQTPANLAQLRQEILTYAKSFLGTPYCWGGDSPKTGFDCSGFVEYVFGHFGIQLPRESHDQATVGTPVSQSSLQPGDLLFFSDTDSYASLYANHVTHVGIYMGNGSMIESSSAHNGEGVVIVQNVFQNPYYVAHYAGARDVIGS
ncbi:C40 family peptidase [Alicyclobacillus mali (ex Roth et al. 2021)]|uniref:C40 family peptidase n=1 Tax=Alicyclobacillus mali (ex Roth et al. 2021) TaxID=1123961 RepID=UPI00082BCD99|nr:LysM peptidoglycan-binding domain-containing C40 family peptidase [Alicyclobacillus mali (ex Roth et al. 2021)]MCL6487956.1 LysM peptidoglycan-binding domain-containing C40 family peptidase [Alicyclobacillus mali (ex Roth et al. 2021)]